LRAPTVRHASYIGSSLEVPRENNRTVVRAALQAARLRHPNDLSTLGSIKPAGGGGTVVAISGV